MKRWSVAGIVLAFLLQAGLLGWMIAGRALLLANGTEVRLAVVPVDPRDFLRGDYVILSYDISNLSEPMLGGDKGFSVGQPIYVSLKPDGATWAASSIHKTYPEAAAQPVLRGTVTGASQPSGCADPCRAYRVAYGLEKFFVPEGEGRPLENLRNDQKLSVDVAIGPDGTAIIKRLRVDGEIRFEAGLF